ncbi:TPA: hypothetical protein ACJ2WV_004936, partial [Kluyvera georgiana]
SVGLLGILCTIGFGSDCCRISINGFILRRICLSLCSIIRRDGISVGLLGILRTIGFNIECSPSGISCIPC